MANVIKHKRGSGSDPVASDLVVGEVAIRTDVGKLFTKMDNGSVAEIAGGGSDIAINTLSSSSGTGGGSATFNGSAYRFTLSSPPSVSAQQLLVSINGVIQKPVAGTGQPSEGFSVDGTDIILGDAPATGSDFFILTFKSLGVSEPADNSVTSAKIADGAIVNADINASAAIAGSKIDPDFGSQGITTTGVISMGNGLTLTGTNPFIDIIDSNNNSDFTIKNDNGTFEIEDKTNSNATRLAIPSSGGVGIGITSVSRTPLHVHEPTSATANIHLTNSTTGSGSTNGLTFFHDGSVSAGIFLRENLPLRFGTNNTERMRIDSSGNVGIGSTSPTAKLEINEGTDKIVQFTGGIGQIGNVAGVFAVNDAKSEIADFGIMGNTLKFASGTAASGAERMRIDSDGRVGIGLTPHTSDVATNITEGLIQTDGSIDIRYSGTNSDPAGARYLNFINTDTTLVAGQPMGGLHWIGMDSNNPNSITAAILADCSGNTGTASHLLFKTGGSERMRLDSSGNVLIGMTSGSTSTQGMMFRPGQESSIFRDSGFNLLVGGAQSGQRLIDFRHNGTSIGHITKSGTTGIAYSETSDYRLKENEVTISDGITRLKKLKPYRFNFKADASTTVDGFFAHEVSTIVPEAVFGDKDAVMEDGSVDPQGIDKSKLVPLLVAALQEAIGRIEALEAK